MGKKHYGNGTWFAIPLRNGGYGTGIIARDSGDGILLIYMFGPRVLRPLQLSEVERLTRHDAVKVSIAGDLGLLRGAWPIIGQALSWTAEAWPVPQFLRQLEKDARAWLVTLADDDPSQVLSEERVSSETTGYERYVISGAGAVEITMTRLLS